VDQGNIGVSRGQVTLLLAEAKAGSSEAYAKVIPLVYRELRRMAGNCMRSERTGHTLEPTALVHEAWLRLVDQSRADWENRAQFMAVAARVMRRILVDYARQRAAAKRGGLRITLKEEIFDPETNGVCTEELLAVDQALVRLRELDAQQERVVEMRYFGGLTVEETAEALGISPRTVKRDWAMAKAWLRSELAHRAAR
jgi:RNA polymerase sigma factor (TIGR02999 family)